MPFQPISLQVTDVYVFIGKKKNRSKATDFPFITFISCSKVIGVKMPRSAKDKFEIEFSFPEAFGIVELYREDDVL